MDYRRAGPPDALSAVPASERWYTKVALLLLGVGLLTFSFAPFGQFYLAWVGLVPWLMVLRGLRSQKAAFLWSWLAGTMFFVANMWWLAYVTGPGMVALMVLLGAYWGVAALIIRGTGLLNRDGAGADNAGRGSSIEDGAQETPRRRLSLASLLHPRSLSASSTLAVLLIAAVWVSLEWLRGNYPLNGLPWLYLGHTQSPILPMCQIADAAGVYGISFWVAALNAWVALFVLDRFRLRRLVRAGAVVAGLLAVTLGYGLIRLAQDTTSPGPLVLVVQPNYPQSNTGEKGAPSYEIVDFHVSKTREALAKTPGVDLVVWSETIMPELNRKARDQTRGISTEDHEDYGLFLEATHDRLKNLAYDFRTGLLVGSIYSDTELEPDPAVAGRLRVKRSDRRNTAFFYNRLGGFSDDLEGRYDKIHIVPFGEYLPFKETFPALHGLFVALSPYPDEYMLKPGSEDAVTVFRLEMSDGGPTTAPATNPATKPATSQAALGAAAPAGGRSELVDECRFVTPICFEDIDPLLVGKMFRDKGQGGGRREKAADLIVNITNDGWFKANQMPQHLQAAQFRSIENRVPTARSVNTGISGFIDSTGRTHDLIRAGVEGTSVSRVKLDSRYTFYTRFGDVFAVGCGGVTVLLATAGLARWVGRRRGASSRAARSPGPAGRR